MVSLHFIGSKILNLFISESRQPISFHDKLAELFRIYHFILDTKFSIFYPKKIFHEE